MNKKLLFTTLVAAFLLSAAAFAVADVSAPIVGTDNGAGKLESSGPVNVKATVNPKLTLTITTPDAGQSVDFGAVDPGSVIGGKTVSLQVNSNKDYSLAKSVSGDSTEIGLATTLAAATTGVKGAGAPVNDAYSINVPWDTAPAAYSATVQYTVTQN